MKIDEIRKQWVGSCQGPEETSKLWDSQADDPTYHNMPSFKDNQFLRLLESEGMIGPSSSVLDLGCGVGVYPIAMSKKVSKAVGIDISSKMLAHGNAILQRDGISNVKLLQADWNTFDLDSEGIRGQFDLVFSHTSPAVGSAASLEKMIDASRRFCAVCNPTSMKEPVLEEVMRIAEIGSGDGNCTEGLSYMMDMLFQLGYKPKLDYEDQVWPMCQDYEKACAYYLGRVSMNNPLPKESEDRVKEYLSSIAEDGMVSDRIDSTVTTVYWEK